MEQFKYCPFTRATSGNISACICERCAWYVRDCCAMVDIADSLAHIAINTVEQE